jgi:hypothetical protein
MYRRSLDRTNDEVCKIASDRTLANTQRTDVTEINSYHSSARVGQNGKTRAPGSETFACMCIYVSSVRCLRSTVSTAALHHLTRHPNVFEHLIQRPSGLACCTQYRAGEVLPLLRSKAVSLRCL